MRNTERQREIREILRILVVLKLCCYPPEYDYRLHVYSVCLCGITIHVTYTSVCIKCPILRVTLDVPSVDLSLGHFLFKSSYWSYSQLVILKSVFMCLYFVPHVHDLWSWYLSRSSFLWVDIVLERQCWLNKCENWYLCWSSCPRVDIVSKRQCWLSKCEVDIYLIIVALKSILSQRGNIDLTSEFPMPHGVFAHTRLLDSSKTF